MRIAATLIISLLGLTQLQADPLSDKERESLMAILSEIQQEANESADKRFRLAITAYRKAMASDEAAMDLYLNCIEKVQFEDQLKDKRDFRNWKEEEEQALSASSFKLALKLQLQWLILSLEASSEKTDRDKLAAEAKKIVGAIFDHIDEVTFQSKVLKQSVSSSVFAKAYNIHGIDANWPQSPVSVAQIYDNVILPQLRTPERLDLLQGAWRERITYEEINATGWASGKEFVFDSKGQRDREKERELRKQRHDQATIAIEKFGNGTRPELIWKMEKDLFGNGDQKGAAIRMINHIRNNRSHKSAAKWTEELQLMLMPEAEKTASEL